MMTLIISVSGMKLIYSVGTKREYLKSKINELEYTVRTRILDI